MSNYKTFPFQIKIADNFSSRLKGLMFKKGPFTGEGLWIIPCNSIHMFFMKFPIDAVFIDKDRNIVKLVEDLQPWKLVKPVKNAHSVVELPVGTIKQLKLQVGDQVAL